MSLGFIKLYTLNNECNREDLVIHLRNRYTCVYNNRD